MDQVEPVDIARCDRDCLDEWIALRLLLWPDTRERDHRVEARNLLLRRRRAMAFLARADHGRAIGFAEVTLRSDYVNGCTTSPVAFLEGIFVRRDYRRRGVARLLCHAVERWAADRGCTEFASDILIRNTTSHRMHTALGFAETERVVFFRKSIARSRHD